MRHHSLRTQKALGLPQPSMCSQCSQVLHIQTKFNRKSLNYAGRTFFNAVSWAIAPAS